MLMSLFLFLTGTVDATTLHLQKKAGREALKWTAWLELPPSPFRFPQCPSALFTSCRPSGTLLRHYVVASAAIAQSLYPMVTLSLKSTTWALRRSSPWIESKPRMLLATCCRVSLMVRNWAKTTRWWCAPDTLKSRSWAQAGNSPKHTCRTLRTARRTPTGPTSSCTSANTTGSSCSAECSGAAGQSGRVTWQPAWRTPSSGRSATGSRMARPRCRRERPGENGWRSRPTLPSTQRALRCLPVWEKVRWQCRYCTRPV